jgi:predicted nucleic acid-binding protein
MKLAVVDSSVAVKWYVPEADAAFAARLQGSGIPLHAPDFIDVGMAAIVWKKIRKGLMTRAVADAILTDFAGLSTMTRHPTTPLVPEAFDLADRSGRTVYDRLYLALAVRLGGVMVTADEKLVNALAGTPWAPHATKLQDVP